jgi:hypothetical protein
MTDKTTADEVMARAAAEWFESKINKPVRNVTVSLDWEAYLSQVRYQLAAVAVARTFGGYLPGEVAHLCEMLARAADHGDANSYQEIASICRRAGNAIRFLIGDQHDQD